MARKKVAKTEETQRHLTVVPRIPPPYIPTNPFLPCGACGRDVVQTDAPTGWSHVTPEDRERCEVPMGVPRDEA